MEPKFLQTNIWIWKFCRAEGQIVPMRGLRNTAYASWVVKMMKIDFYLVAYSCLQKKFWLHFLSVRRI